MPETSEGLDSWADADADIFAAMGRVSAHPNFPAAARTLARAMLEISADDRALDAIFKDAGRYFAAMWGFALHEDGGLTLPRLKAVCSRSGLLSPGRARSLLQFLQHFAYLDRVPVRGGPDLYAPTPAFLVAWDRHFIAALEAARLISPDIDPFLDTGGPRLRQSFGRIHAEGMLAAMGVGGEAAVSDFLRVFLHPYAGSHILRTLVVSDADPAFPPARAGPVSIAGLARISGASRVQVSRIFHEAADAGLAELDADGFVIFQPAAREQLGVFYAIQLVQILAAAAQASRAEFRKVGVGTALPAV
ncbi:hypothetical protein [uncultured Phenylobacterium sp.]|uniref:hypothetical protein n=1 Tax=uncultured Phenylobacterium sp. TaxID=349273 RepID=UPI0025FD7063|nr:hypothetical protein [uncultured Phenylobacterium sp.]